MSRYPLIASLALALLAGAGLGFQAGRSAPAPRADEVSRQLDRQSALLEGLTNRMAALERGAPAPAPAAAPGARSAQDPTFLHDAIRAAMRNELVEQAGQIELEKATAAAPTPEEVAAFDRGDAIVRKGLTAKRWSQGDVDEMRTILPRLSADQRASMMQQIIVALNEKQMTADFRGPPF